MFIVLLVLGGRTGVHRFTGLGWEDWCSSFYWSWVGGLVFIVLLVLGGRAGVHRFTGLRWEDWCSSFYWS